jgi:hypothetical protein
MAKITTRLDGGSGVNRSSQSGVTTAAATATDAWYNWIQVLLAAGWTHVASGTGTAGTFSTTPGNANLQITHAGTGAGGLDRNNAWVVLEDPGGRRQFLLQRGTSNTSWRFYYSALDGFVGTGFGAISATVPPSATDQQQMIGSAGGYAGTHTTSGTWAYHCVAYDAPEGDVYPWFVFATEVLSGKIGSLVYCDAMRVGTYDALDADPCVVYPAPGAGGASITTSFAVQRPYGGASVGGGAWYRMNLSSEAFVAVNAMIGSISSSGVFLWGNNNSSGGIQANQGGCAPDPFDLSEPMVEMYWARGTASMAGSQGVKGASKYLRWAGCAYRAHDAILDGDTADAYLYCGAFLVPWPINTPLVSV